MLRSTITSLVLSRCRIELGLSNCFSADARTRRGKAERAGVAHSFAKVVSDEFLDLVMTQLTR